MTSRVIRSDDDFAKLVAFLGLQERPFTVSVMKGANRTSEQNRLQRLWLKEVSEQWEGHGEEEIRGHWKLHYGVPILRRDDEEFRRKYDLIIKPHSYEEKLAMMQEPLSFPVTSLMTTRQKKEYLDKVYMEFTKQGFELTLPPEKEPGRDRPPNSIPADNGGRSISSSRAATANQYERMSR